MRARAVSFAAPRVVELAEVEVGEPGPGQVLVRTSHSGISAGTEMLAYRGEIDPALPLDESIAALAGDFRYPFRYGYSCAGWVERSRSPLAEGRLVFALHPHQDRFVADDTEVVELDGIEPRTATLFPLVETALQVALDSGPALGDLVVVLGLGVVGLLVALLLERGGARVVGADPRPDRREVAAGLGLEAVRPEELGARVASATGGRGAALAVEVSGNPAVLAGALELLAHEGTAVVASWYGSKEVPLPLGGDFHRRRLTIRSSQVSTIPARLQDRWDVGRRRAAVRELLGELPLATLATHEFPLARAADAFAAVDRGDEGLLHAALCYL